MSSPSSDCVPLLQDVALEPRAASKARYRTRRDVANKQSRPAKRVRFAIELTEPKDGPPPSSYLNGTTNGTRAGRPSSDDNTASTTLVSDTQTGRVSRFAPTNPVADAELVLRVILEILAFSYGVDRVQLQSSLSGCKLQMATQKDRRHSLLTQDNATRARQLGAAATLACKKIVHDNRGGLTFRNRLELIKSFIEPAENVGIPPAYYLEKLMEYGAHRCASGQIKQSLLYKEASNPVVVFGRTIMPLRWSSSKQQQALARRIVTDEFILSKFEQLDDACMVIRIAIAAFQRKYCKPEMTRIPRVAYLDPIPTAIADNLRSEMSMRLKDPETGVVCNLRGHAPFIDAADVTTRSLRSGSLQVHVDDSPAYKSNLGPSRSRITTAGSRVPRRNGPYNFTLEDLRNGTVRPEVQDKEPRAHTALARRQDRADWHGSGRATHA